MKQVVQLLALIGLLMNCAPAQEKVTESAQKQATEGTTDNTSPRPARYIDVRERKASTLTFTWRKVRSAIYEKKHLQRMTSEEPDKPPQISEEVIKLDEEHFLVPDLRATYTILRTPKLSCIRAQEELPLVGNNFLGKSNEALFWDYYYLGDSGEIVISALRGWSGSSDFGMVHIGYSPCGGFGLPSPFVGPYSPGEMIFLGGVSPFRLLGAEPSDWKLVEVNEAEWVFELKIEEARRDHFKGLLPSGEQVRFHLSRKHGDAPLRLEFRSERGYEKWETLAFTQVQGIWMPQTVSCETIWGGTTNQLFYDLQGVSQTATVEIDIPLRNPVRDWRGLALDLWRSRDDEKSIVVEWTPELLSSLWKTVHQEARD